MTYPNAGNASVAAMGGLTSIPATITTLATNEYDRRTLTGGKALDEAFAADARKKGKAWQGRSG